MQPKVNHYSTGCNAVMVEIGRLTLYFSYQTVVAFKSEDKLVVSENVWGKTTARHINSIDGGNKAHRLDRASFKAALEKLLAFHRL